MAKAPAIQLYVKDWKADTDGLSLEAKGAWIQVICTAHLADKRGRVARTPEQWARIFGETIPTTIRVLRELSQLESARVTFGRKNVTVTSRRMETERKVKEADRLRKRRQRASGRSHEKVTPYTASASATASATPPIVPHDEKIQGMDPKPGESPFGPRPDIAVDAAVAHLDAKWLDLEANGHRDIPRFTPDQIVRFLKNLHGVLEVQKVKANDIVRAWLAYGKRMADPKQKQIPWCPWYVRDLLTRDAARKAPRPQQDGPTRIQKEIAAFTADGGKLSPDTAGGKKP